MKLFILLFVLNNINAQLQKIDNEYLGVMKSVFITNLTVLVGEHAILNCSIKATNLNNKQNNDFLENSFHLSSLTTLNPTWLKAENKYDKNGEISGFNNENIIVTRKGAVIDTLKDRLRLVGLNDRIQSLRLNDITAKDEGKYICREFNSENDKIFYLKVFGMHLNFLIKRELYVLFVYYSSFC